MFMLIGAGVVALVLLISFFTVTGLRRVVPTNEVHIVQSAKRTTSYGANTGNGNTYYEWPNWLPLIGISKSVLPLNNFKLMLEDYEALDSGRLPFEIDIQAFFRITDSNKAASRISSFAELTDQLIAIVKGAARVVLAASDIEEILGGRATLGKRFTDEVDDKLSLEFGVAVVGYIELMDIRDTAESKVIHNIMDKKKSHIEMQSRTEVARNKQAAAIAEIEAQKEVDIQAQSAKQEVGLRTTQSEQEVALAQQRKIQAVKEQEKSTKEKEMAVTQIQTVRQAEINKQAQVVAAEADKQQVVLKAEANLELKRREAEGISLEGKARADAERAMLLAPVEAQTTLATAIGENKNYQEYLITVKKVEASQAIGVEQAKALANADIKVISNTGTPTEGLTGVMDLFSSKGGTQVGSMLEALANTDQGQKLLKTFTGSSDTPSNPEVKVNGVAKPYTNGAGR